MATKPEATIADLYHQARDAKAELVGGEIILMSPTGDLPGYAGFTITASLRSGTPRFTSEEGSLTPAVRNWRLAVDDLFLPEDDQEFTCIGS